MNVKMLNEIDHDPHVSKSTQLHVGILLDFLSWILACFINVSKKYNDWPEVLNVNQFFLNLIWPIWN